MHRRLVAGVQKLDRAGDQLVLRKLFAGRLGGDQMADQIVARLLAPLGDVVFRGTRRIPASPPPPHPRSARFRPGVYIATILCDQSTRRGPSSTGTPRSSAMTVTGIGVQ